MHEKKRGRAGRHAGLAACVALIKLEVSRCLNLSLSLSLSLSLCSSPRLLIVSPRINLLLFIVVALFVSSPVVHVQAAEESLAGRIDRLSILLHSNQLIAARPLIAQVRGEVPPEMVANLDFYLALSYVFEYYENNNSAVLTTAAEQFEAFIKTYPNHSLSALARYNLADVHAINQKFKEALQLYVPLYRQPVASVDRKEVLGKLVLINQLFLKTF